MNKDDSRKIAREVLVVGLLFLAVAMLWAAYEGQWVRAFGVLGAMMVPGSFLIKTK